MKTETKTLTIMFTDIKGFTDRTSHSSREQLHKMLDLHEKLITPVFEDFGGTIVKTIGDAFMVTFNSPTDALLCGMKIQRVLSKHNEENKDETLEVRIAINAGEVTIKGNDVFGDAVNIAARLEGIADAGDIYFTEAVYLAMNKAEIPTAEVGYRHFKGIPEEIKVYKVVREGKKGIFGRDKLLVRESRHKKWNWKRILKWVGIILLILIIIGNIAKNNQQKGAEAERLKIVQGEVQGIKNDFEDAYISRDIQRMKSDIDKLNELSDKMNHPAELDKTISDFRARLNELISSQQKIGIKQVPIQQGQIIKTPTA